MSGAGDCGECGGDGHVYVPGLNPMADGKPDPIPKTCATCGGTGNAPPVTERQRQAARDGLRGR